MNVLIVGSTGQVGSELIKLAPDYFNIIAPASSELDVTNKESVDDCFVKFDPIIVINASAYTAVDKAEEEIKKAFDINDNGVKNIAMAAGVRGIPVFHISTDYVFCGEKETPYTESDATNPIGVYGASKLAGEKALTEFCDKHIILRTSWVFSSSGNNFVKTMLRLGKDRPEISVVSDQFGCPTSAASIAKALWAFGCLLYKHDGTSTKEDFPWGLYHYSNKPSCSWYDFAQEIFKQSKQLGLLECEPDLKGISTSEYPTLAKRPNFSILDCEKIKNLGFVDIPEWQSELNDVLSDLI